MPDDVRNADKSFGEQLRLHREHAGYTLAELATLVHFSVSYLSRVENGLRPALPHLAQRCDAALGTSGALEALAAKRPAGRDDRSGAASQTRATKATKIGGQTASRASSQAKLLSTAPAGASAWRTALAVDQLRVGQIPSALATLERHRTYAGRHPSAMARWHQCIFDTLLDLWRGNFEACAEWIFGESQVIVAELEANMEIPADTLRQTRLGQAYWLLHEQGRMADLFTSGLASGMERYGYSPIWRAGMILALCETDRWTDAADQMVAFAEDTDGFRTLPPSGWAIPTLTLLAEACAGLAIHGHYLDELTGLTPLIDGALASHHAEIALAGWPTVLVGPVARARGLLALAAGDDARAVESFHHAARRGRTSPPLMARLRADRARALLLHPSHEAREEAARLLATSLSAAKDLGMTRLASDILTIQAARGADKQTSQDDL